MERKSTKFGLVGVLFIFSCLYFYPSLIGLSKPPEVPTANSSYGDTHQPGTVSHKEDEYDGILRYTRIDHSIKTEILFLVLTKDADSWGYNQNEPRRRFNDFLDLLKSTSLDLKTVSLGILTSSKQEYDLFRTATEGLGLGRETIFIHSGYADEDISRDHRHDGEAQGQRRSQIAQLRNYLMLRALNDESHIIWLDADIYEFHSPQIIQRMISHAKQPNIGIITARCEIGSFSDYDRNAWAGTLGRASIQGVPGSACTDGDTAPDTRNVAALVEGTSDDDIIRLDSVGATLLYMRANLVHRGLSFPDQYVIGTTWMKAGWDGIESEGLCYRSRYMKGGECYVLGGSWSVKHTHR